MTLESFKSELKAYHQREKWSGAFFMLLVALFAPPALYINRRVEQVGFDMRCILVLAISFSVFAIAGFYVLCRLPNRKVQMAGLQCPHCHKLLAGLNSQVVVATGNCGFCGGKVLEDKV